MDLDLAETLGKRDEVVLAELLVVKDQHLMREPGRLDRIGVVSAEPAQIDPRYLAAECRRQPAHAYRHRFLPEIALAITIPGSAGSAVTLRKPPGNRVC